MKRKEEILCTKRAKIVLKGRPEQATQNAVWEIDAVSINRQLAGLLYRVLVCLLTKCENFSTRVKMLKRKDEERGIIAIVSKSQM